jgi:hypothetical protein
MIRDLFEEDVRDVRLAPGAMLLGGFARRFEAACVTALRWVVEVGPFRHMVTPGGHRMSVAMTNGGAAGWVTDRTGYRYDSHDPQTGRRWPAMPDVFADLAADLVRSRVDVVLALGPASARAVKNATTTPVLKGRRHETKVHLAGGIRVLKVKEIPRSVRMRRFCASSSLIDP